MSFVNRFRKEEEDVEVAAVYETVIFCNSVLSFYQDCGVKWGSLSFEDMAPYITTGMPALLSYGLSYETFYNDEARIREIASGTVDHVSKSPVAEDNATVAEAEEEEEEETSEELEIVSPPPKIHIEDKNTSFSLKASEEEEKAAIAAASVPPKSTPAKTTKGEVVMAKPTQPAPPLPPKGKGSKQDIPTDKILKVLQNSSMDVSALASDILQKRQEEGNKRTKKHK